MLKMKERHNLRFIIIAILLIVSLLPLALLSIGSWVVFGRLLEEKALELQRTVVESHARAIEAYLNEHLKSLRILAAIHSLEDITDRITLQMLLTSLNNAGKGGFIDLGVIGSNGEHLSYVGPYDLLDRNYYKADWFKQVMAESIYISDVFLGFRQVPHCIIAVRNYSGADTWILRATIDSEQFDELVRTGIIGETGDAYIINREGLYQTTPQVGSVLTQSPITNPEYFRGTCDQKLRVNGSKKIRVTTWINENNWLLVVQQDASEVWAPVNRAIASGALIVLLAMALIIVTTYLATRHLTGRIDRANERREEMFRAFTRSAKLASIGELATGLAHEINNPLAIISADQTNISDIVSDMSGNLNDKEELTEALERSKRQIIRCKSITTKMLQFGRKRDTELKPTEIAGGLQEITDMLNRQASVRNVELLIDVEEKLPSVLIDPVELEQVLMNLIHNSFHALPNGGHIHIIARSERNEVFVEVKDDGAGIPPEDLERIFEPFFTTKPVGKGTGLGLSVCYGIVQSWGGRIEAESEPGKGTVMRIRIPLHNRK